MIIYTTPTCTYCQKAKEFMDKEGIKYETVDIYRDAIARALVLKETGRMSVPAFENNGNWLSGFSEDGVKRLASM